MTESKRQQQVSKLVLKTLNDIFLKSFKSDFDGAFITITDVKMSPDLAIAKVYLSFLLTENKELTLEKIRENTKKIRGFFGNATRNQLRIIPNFQFYIDDTAEQAQHIEKIISKLDIKPEESSEE